MAHALVGLAARGSAPHVLALAPRCGRAAAFSALLIAASSTASAATKYEPSITVSHDRFKAQTVIRAELKYVRGFTTMWSCGRPSIAWVAIVPDAVTADTPAHLAFVTGASCSEWAYLRCNTVTALADSGKIELGQQDHDGEVSRSGGGVYETVVVSLSRDALDAMNSAGTLDFQQCKSEWRLAAEEKNVLGLFAAKVNELLPRSAPAVVTPDVPAAKPKASCTVEQKVEMVKLGLTAEQILAACPN